MKVVKGTPPPRLPRRLERALVEGGGRWPKVAKGVRVAEVVKVVKVAKVVKVVKVCIGSRE
jgi:hypothetical protein